MRSITDEAYQLAWDDISPCETKHIFALENCFLQDLLDSSLRSQSSAVKFYAVQGMGQGSGKSSTRLTHLVDHQSQILGLLSSIPNSP